MPHEHNCDCNLTRRRRGHGSFEYYNQHRVRRHANTYSHDLRSGFGNGYRNFRPDQLRSRSFAGDVYRQLHDQFACDSPSDAFGGFDIRWLVCKLPAIYAAGAGAVYMYANYDGQPDSRCHI
jgi:hypothetical protein